MKIMAGLGSCVFLCSVLGGLGLSSSALASECIRPTQCTSGSTGNNHVTIRTGTTIPGGRTQESVPSSPVRTVVNVPRATYTYSDCRELGRFRGCIGSRISSPVNNITQTEWAPITLEDIAEFIPNSSSVVTEPHGWGVVGLPANMVNSAGVHVVEGMLFDSAAQVRFTPRGVDWDYGDGTQKFTTVVGALWSDLGIPELSATQTSHVFVNTGHYEVNAVVHYSAEYHYLSGQWQSIDGEVTAQALPASVDVLNAATRLMTHECRSAADAPGC